jgi:hypothetical protein
MRIPRMTRAANIRLYFGSKGRLPDMFSFTDSAWRLYEQ